MNHYIINNLCKSASGTYTLHPFHTNCPNYIYKHEEMAINLPAQSAAQGKVTASAPRVNINQPEVDVIPPNVFFEKTNINVTQPQVNVTEPKVNVVPQIGRAHV